MLRRALAGIILFLFLSITAWLIYVALRPDVLPLGASMPALDYRSSNGHKTFAPDSSQSTMIVHFHSNCKYCKYQLTLFNENLERFSDSRLIFMTIEEDFLQKNEMNAWPILKTAQNVFWCEVDQKHFEDSFGSLAVPSIFIFDKFGTLVSKIRGEAKLEKISKELKKSGGPEHRVSGYN